jgi:signal transduction histidine kinase
VVTTPTRPEPATTPAPERAEATDHHARRRPVILVVDDEEHVRRSVHDLLRIEFQVVALGSGAEALEYLASDSEVSAILSDQRMPGMTGVEVLRRVAEIRPETTRLLFTAFADLRTVIAAINEGHVFRYIAKPWDPAELQTVIRQAVERYDLIVEKNRLVTELQAANARLREADRLKGAFLEVASHELNTPVTVVKGLTDLWKMSQAPAATAAEVEWVDRIQTAAGRLAKTVQRMLKLIDGQNFGRPLAVAPVELASLIAQAVDVLAPYLEKRDQRVEVAAAPDLGPVECDPDKIHDVLVNLLANAVKFTPDGMTIHVEAGEDSKDPGSVRVAVRDRGVGIDPVDRRFLFEPFFTGFDTLHHSSGDYQFGKRGMGLGLCLVKTFVELHGGRVEAYCPTADADADADGGRGSVFAFTIPRRRPQTDAT